MSRTGELHERAMDLYDSALFAARRRDIPTTRRLLAEALALETAAADSVANEFRLEPTRSILYRSAASIALKLGEVETVKRYAQAGLAGEPPPDTRGELSLLIEQALTLEAVTRDYRRTSPVGLTRVQLIIRQFTFEAPVNIVGLARQLGLAVRQAKLGLRIAGELFRDYYRGGSSGFTIRVNQSHPVVRKRFTVAHEIAHFLRHRNRVGNLLIDDVMYRSRLDRTVEQEANRLAAELLIPGALLAQIRRGGMEDPEELARMFGVSIQAMKRRMHVKDRFSK